MGWVADARLVAATGNAGGFGFLAAATIPPTQLEEEILAVKALTKAPFGLNFHMFQPNAKEVVECVVRHGVKAVSYGRGPDKTMIKRLKDAGVVCIPTVGLPQHAIKAVALGADAVVIQGHEGGGHTGPVATTVLLPAVIDAVKVPVVAAGGFYDGHGLAAALIWGAQGIAMGTRFLMTTDSPVPDETLAKYLAVDSPQQVIVSTALDGLPQRMLRNEFLDRLENAGWWRMLWTATINGLRFRRFTGASIGTLLASAWQMKRSGLSFSQALMAANAPMIIQKAMVDGQPDEGVLPGGQAAARIDSLLSCQQLIEQIVQQACSSLEQARDYVTPQT